MKYLLTILITQFFYNPTPAQQTEQVFETVEAKIIEIETFNRANRKYGVRTSVITKVEYIARDGEKYKSQVQLVGIPFIGTLKSVNDSITVLYDTNNPMILKTKESSFLEAYGLYILIVVGIFYSLFNLRRIRCAKTKLNTK